MSALRSIKIKDLEIIEQEKNEQELPQKNVALTLAQLAVENKKKDVLIQSLSQTVATLNIEMAKLKGGDA